MGIFFARLCKLILIYFVMSRRVSPLSPFLRFLSPMSSFLASSQLRAKIKFVVNFYPSTWNGTNNFSLIRFRDIFIASRFIVNVSIISEAIMNSGTTTLSIILHVYIHSFSLQMFQICFLHICIYHSSRVK